MLNSAFLHFFYGKKKDFALENFLFSLRVHVQIAKRWICKFYLTMIVCNQKT